jgi:hypothetical protein
MLFSAGMGRALNRFFSQDMLQEMVAYIFTLLPVLSLRRSDPVVHLAVHGSGAVVQKL